MSGLTVAPSGRRPEVLGAAGAAGEASPAWYRVLLALGAQEGRRMVLHPVFLTGYLIMAGITAYMPVANAFPRWEGDDGFGPADAFGAIDSAPTFFAGVFAIVAANLVATRDRRSRSGELLAPVPVDPHLRTAGLCLGALVPAAFVLLHNLVVLTAFTAFDLFFVVPGPGHVLQGPVTVLGGALTGVMVARWVPWTGGGVVAVVALVAFNLWTNPGDPVHATFGMAHSWARWAPEGAWAGLVPGSPTWHVVYLLGLCGCAAAAALLRTAPAKLPVLAGGAVCALVAAAGGLAQLP